MDNMQKTNEKESFWGRMAKKNNASSYDIAEKTNIPEEKVKEIINGERSLPTNHVDDFVKACSQTKKESRKSKRNEALIFFAGKNLKQLRLKFNYKKQSQLANELGVSQGTLSKAETQGVGTLNTTTLLKLYNFFKDELNIRLNKKDIKVQDIRKTNITKEEKEKELSYYREYFKENDLKYLIEDKGMTIPQFANSIDISPSTIYKFLRGKISWTLKLYKKVYNGLNNIINEIVDEDIDDIDDIEEQLDLSIDNKGTEENYNNISCDNCISKDTNINTTPTKVTPTTINTTMNGFDSRVSRNSAIYTDNQNVISTGFIPETIKYYNVFPNFNPEDLFYYLINNCITKDVVELYKLFDKYFKNN